MKDKAMEVKCMSPRERESKTVLVYGILDSTPRIPDSRYWIPVFHSGT